MILIVGGRGQGQTEYAKQCLNDLSESKEDGFRIADGNSDEPKMAQRLFNPFFVHTCRDIICGMLYRFRGVAHGNSNSRVSQHVEVASLQPVGSRALRRGSSFLEQKAVA